VKALGRIFDPEIQGYRLFITVAAIFGAVALMVAAAGIYALMSFTLARRTARRALRIQPTEALRTE
jgi:hypothetical protein